MHEKQRTRTHTHARTHRTEYAVPPIPATHSLTLCLVFVRGREAAYVGRESRRASADVPVDVNYVPFGFSDKISQFVAYQERIAVGD